MTARTRQRPNVRTRLVAGFLAATTAALTGGLIVTASVAAASPEIHPSNSTFSARFPYQPRQLSGHEVRQQFPGASAVVDYVVSPNHAHLFAASAPVPPAPTEVVATGLFPTARQALAYVRTVSRQDRMRPVTVHGLAGGQFLGRESSSINPGSSVKQPRAYESIVAVNSDNVVYIAIAINTSAVRASRFTHSLAAVAGSALTGGPVPAQLGTPTSGHHWTLYRIGRLVGIALLVALALATLARFLPSKRRSSGGRHAASTHGPPTIGADGHFGWLYEDPNAAPVATPTDKRPL